VDLAYVDRDYSGEEPAAEAEVHSVRLEVVKLPAYRFGSTWMSIILHSAQSVYFAFLVLGVVLGLA
jgi:hypothetical protein